MKLYGLEKLSLVDYDGYVAATVFTGNCNFKCGFCHNSSLVNGVDYLSPIDEEEVFSYLKKRFGILEGVCVSGGEPTLSKGLLPFLEKIKKIGYSIKLDTNGTNPDVVKSAYESGLVDYFAMDIKDDKGNYGEIIGIKGFDTLKVEKTVEYLISCVKDYEFRTTLIKEYHSEENIKKIGQWIEGANKYVFQKFIPNENCIESGLNGIEKEEAEKFLLTISPFVKSVKLRGY